MDYKVASCTAREKIQVSRAPGKIWIVRKEFDLLESYQTYR